MTKDANGLWSLVLGMVTERVAVLALLVATVRWRPRLQFEWSRFQALFRFTAQMALLDVITNPSSIRRD